MRFKQSGISMVEAIVGLGIATAIGLVLMKQQETASKMQSKNNTNQIVNSAANTIQTALSNRAICSLSLMDKGPGDTIPYLYEGTPRADWDGNDPRLEYMAKTPLVKPVAVGTTLPGDVKIDRMMIITDAATGKDFLRVTFDVDPNGRKKQFGARQLVKNFEVQGLKDPVTKKYISCHSEQSNILNSAVQQACIKMGATWDEDSGKCKLTNLPNCIYTSETCRGVFSVKAGEWQTKVYAFAGRICTMHYDRESFACGSDFDRTCTCNTPGCTCNDGFNRVSCYSREDRGCADKPWTETLTPLNRCCQP